MSIWLSLMFAKPSFPLTLSSQKAFQRFGEAFEKVLWLQKGFWLGMCISMIPQRSTNVVISTLAIQLADSSHAVLNLPCICTRCGVIPAVYHHLVEFLHTSHHNVLSCKVGLGNKFMTRDFGPKNNHEERDLGSINLGISDSNTMMRGSAL